MGYAAHQVVYNDYFWKWEELLLVNITERDQCLYNTIPFKCVTLSTLQWFQYQLLHFILPVNYLLCKMGYIETDLCSYSKKDRETIFHLFCECPMVISIWTKLKLWLKNEADVDINLHDINILIGYTNSAYRPINTILILIKKIIFDHRVRHTMPEQNITPL